MSGPWERYASPPVPGGPWEQYAQGDALPAPQPLSATDRGALALSNTMDALTTTPYIGGTLRALRDRAQGITQVIARPFASEEDMRVYEQMRRGSEKKYQDFRAQQGDEGMDIDRAVGGAAIDAVLTSRLMGGSMRNPIAPAPTMLGRMRQGAQIGGTAGMMSPVSAEKEGGEFWLTKGLQAAGGAAIGGVAPLVMEPVIAGLAAGANKVVSRLQGLGSQAAGKTTDQAIQLNLAVELQRGGVDWNALSSSVKKSMVRDVREAIKAGKPLTPDQLARYADFKELGEAATRGQTTLNPMLYKTEQNLKGVQGVGDDLTSKFDSQNARVFEWLDKSLKNAGSPNAEARDAGASVARTLSAVNQQNRAAVTRAYDAARSAAGQEAEVPMTRLAQTFGEMRGRIDMDLLPSPVKSRLASYGLLEGRQTKAFTLADAEDFIQTINANYDPSKLAAARVLKQLRDATKASINDVADSSIPAAPLFGEARKTAAQRFAQLERTPALQAAKDGKLSPDDVIDRFVIGKAAKVDDVKNLLEAGGESVKNDLRAAVLGRLVSAAQGRSPDGARQFQFADFDRLVDRIGQDKLKLLFTPAEVEGINRLVRVGSVMNFNPRSVTINRSGTSQAILDLMQRAQGVPFVNRLVAAPVMSAVQQNQAYNAANAGLSGLPGGLLTDRLRAQLAEQGGLLGAAAAAPLPGLLLQ